MSTPAQKRAQHMRCLLGSVGATIQHARTTIVALEIERNQDHSMKTRLNAIAQLQLNKLRLQLIETEGMLQTLNDHFRNYPKPTPTKFEKLETEFNKQLKENHDCK